MDNKPSPKIIKKTVRRTIRSGNKQLALDMLTQDVLTACQDADLYALKASLLLKGDLEGAESAIEESLSIDPDNVLATYYRGMLDIEKGDFMLALNLFEERLVGHPDEPAFHQGLAVALESLGRLESVDAFNRAIELDPANATIYNSRGVMFGKRGAFEAAQSDFLKGIELTPDYGSLFNNLRLVFEKSKDFEGGVKIFGNLITEHPKQGIAYFNRAILLGKLKRYREAIQDIQKYLELASDGGYFRDKAVAMLAELPTLAKNENYRRIDRLIGDIRSALLFKGERVTHYTSLTVARLLILENSKFRISEGTFLNDASEGRELFDFLPPIVLDGASQGDIVSMQFAPKPFIGSFVEATKSNDLTLWRMYGKENKDEARGCAIIFSRERVLGTLSDLLMGDSYQSNPYIDFLVDDEVDFFRVAYRESGKKAKFNVPGLSAAANKRFNLLMGKLHENISEMLSGEELSEDDRKTLAVILNSITFLFKSSEYQYEQEIRLVMSGLGTKKKVDVGEFPRVYVELFEVKSLIKGIMFGPKVEMAQEWAASFHYELDKAGFSPEIRISKIPFK